MTPERQAFDRAVGFFQTGNLAEAERLCLQMLAAAPGSFQLSQLLGAIRAAQGRNTEALALLGAALTQNPHATGALLNYSNVLKALGRDEEALAYCDKVLALEPDHAGALYNRGNLLLRLRRFGEALADYDKALARDPGRPEVLNNRGMALHGLRRYEEALAGYDKALAIDPANAEALNNRAAALFFLGRASEALASYDRALEVRPDYTDALHSRGMIRWREGQHYAAAVSDLERVIAMDPDHDYAQGDLLHLRMHAADWSGFEQQVSRVDAGVRAGKRIVDPFMYLAISQSPADSQACARIFSEQFYPSAPMLRHKTGRRHGKIRIGYVSGEFRAQATAYLTVGLYECHDKSRFEIVAFDNGGRGDSPMCRRLEAAFDRLVPIAHLSDQAAAEKIAAEEIDILVSLNGYFGDHRMGVFARKPAPVQVNYLGFPGTLGAGYIDYILADRVVIPPDERQYYTERVVYLPGSYQVNDSRRHKPQGVPRRSDHGLPETAFVFCNFNMGYKFTPALFAVWMRILTQVEGSVLWLLESNAASPANLRREAERQGVAGERLVFAPFLPMEKQLDRLQLADLFLDSLPCNAHTTASDALWAGVPLLTCRGDEFLRPRRRQSFAGRGPAGAGDGHSARL